MKNIALTSIAALAIVACSDTTESQLDDAYDGGGEEAVELVEGTPEVSEPSADIDETVGEVTPESTEAVLADPLNEVEPSELVELPVETAAPELDGVVEESGVTSVEELGGENLENAVEEVAAEAADATTVVEGVEETLDVPDTEELIDDAAEALEEKVDEVVEETTDTETPQ